MPGYKAIIFRRTGPQLTKQLVPRAKALYRSLFPRGSVRWHSTDRRFTFPSGATIEFGSADKEAHIERFQGFEFAFIAFDELTAFTQYQYTFMASRLRTTVPGLPTRVRAATNPGGPGHDWVLKRWAPWLYPPGHTEYDGRRARAGEVLWFDPVEDSEDEERIIDVSEASEQSTSRTFFPSKVSDTPQLGAEYEQKNLARLDRLTRKRLKDGDWMAREVAGEFFERGWFEIVDALPRDIAFRVRYWDLAATPEKRATPTTAWTAGLLLAVDTRGCMYIAHIARGQLSPHQVEATIRTTQQSDEIEDPDTISLIERDPAQAGKFQQWYFGRELGIKAIAPRGDKLRRALRASAQAEAGNIKIVRGVGSARWIEPFLREAESFPEGLKDQIDALAGAVQFAKVRWAKMRGSE